MRSAIGSLIGLLTLVGLVVQGPAATEAQEAEVLLDNAWVRITRTDRTAGSNANAPSAVAVALENSQDWRVGDAFWLREASGTEIGDFIVLEPKLDGPEVEIEGGSAPGEAEFVGLSFRELFADDHVEVHGTCGFSHLLGSALQEFCDSDIVVVIFVGHP